MVRYYVTIVRSASQRGFLLGPYTNHADAIANVERGRKLAQAADAWADFDSFGTASVAGERQPLPVFGLGNPAQKPSAL